MLATTTKRKKRTRWTKHVDDRYSETSKGLLSRILVEPIGFDKGAKLKGAMGYNATERRFIIKEKNKLREKIHNVGGVTAQAA